MQVGLGSRASAIERLDAQGDFKETGNPLDLVIGGDGFFQVTMPDGQLGYTRDGSFRLNAQGQMMTADGYLLSPSITIPPEARSRLTVGQDGSISSAALGSGAQNILGNITIARFNNPAGLEAFGDNVLRATPASGDPIVGTPGQEGFGMIRSGTLEMSNVKVVEEMVDMITAQRAYEINSKSIQTSDEMLQIANNLRR
jgi:flagellar basal-body rod protein FlgG